MKKILLGLLSFILILISFRVVGNMFNDEEIVVPTPTPSEEVVTPTATTDVVLPTVDTTIVEKDDTYAPIEVDNVTEFESTWYCTSTDGNVESNIYFDHVDINVLHNGSNIESNSFFRDGISLQKGITYTITFEACSSINRNIEFRLLNADTWATLYQESVLVTPEVKNYAITFKMENDSIWNGRIAFNFGNNGVNEEHTLTLSKIMVNSDAQFSENIRINHIGYKSTNQKRCILPYNQGDYFNVLNDDNEVVYTGAIVHKIQNEETNEVNYYGDFTNVTTPGVYRIVSQLGGTSERFVVGEKIFKDVFNETLKFFTIQRCGMTLDGNLLNGYKHNSCHNHEAIIYDYQGQRVDVNGGWHDAGDYGRYVTTGTKAVNDLMLSYLYNPSVFTDDVGIMESGDGIPDILNEARYELEWLLKMQTSNGAVYSKATTPNFANDISPDEDNQELYVLTYDTLATADFAATMAIANMTYKDIDKDFSKLCLEKAKLAWEYLLSTPGLVTYENPSDINSGLYRDDKDSDERFFAAMALYTATDDKKYLDYAKDIYNNDNTCIEGNSYQYVGFYGAYLYLMNDESTKDVEFYNVVKDALVKKANELIASINDDGYGVSIDIYRWGSNGDVCDNALTLLFAYDVTKDEVYRQAAVAQLDYIFGKNSLNMTFVTGFGRNYPTQPHHRPSKALELDLKGALVGGPDNNRDDNITRELSWDIPVARVYVDDYYSYSSNEVAIYWNSSLIHMMTRLKMF